MMPRRPAVFLFILVLSTALAACLWYSRRKLPYNVVVITLDALRADHLSCYGYERKTSPFLDALARRGVLFTQAISVGVQTPVSLATVFTGTYPDVHRVYNFRYGIDVGCSTLPRILRGNGFVTAATRGYTWLEDLLPAFGKEFDALIDGGMDFRKPLEPYIQWISRNRARKFFLWLHFMDQPHAPYTAPPPFDVLFSNPGGYPSEDIPVVDNPLGIGGLPRFIQEGGITDKRYYLSRYDAEIAYADYHIGRLIEELRRMRLLDRTLLVITSAVGEDLGEHGVYFSHGTTLYEGAIRVPLIMVLKSRLPAGRVIGAQVSSVDIVPTILDIIGVPKPGQMIGRSLVPLWSGKGVFREEAAYSYAAPGFAQFVTVGAFSRKYSVRESGWKLINEGNNWELYNIERDPAERLNLAGTEAGKYGYLRNKLLAWKKICEPAAGEAEKVPVDRELLKRFKDLGYW